MTKRTKAALDILFADNSAGAISPEDLRDFLDSIMGVYGSIVIEAGSTGQTIASGVAEQLTEWTADGISNGVTPAFATDQITINHDGDYEIFFQISFQGINGVVFKYTLYKNGSALPPSCQRKTANTDVGSESFLCQIALVATDVLSIWVEGDGSGTFTAVETQFAVRRIG